MKLCVGDKEGGPDICSEAAIREYRREGIIKDHMVLWRDAAGIRVENQVHC